MSKKPKIALLRWEKGQVRHHILDLLAEDRIVALGKRSSM